MQITIEGVGYKLPTSLMSITLQQRIDFDSKYGKALKERLNKIIDMTEGPERDLELADYHMESACKTLSFFGNIPLDIVEQTDISQVLIVYRSTLRFFAEDVDFASKDFELDQEFTWKKEKWRIAPPELTYNSKMTYGEFADAKQAVKDLWETGNEKWEALHNLCCVYFRKVDEPYDKGMIADGSERFELMKTLPFQYALHVGFFLNASLHSWLTTYRSSIQQEEKASESLESISSNGNG